MPPTRNQGFGKCLGCYHPLHGEAIYHPRCSKALFGQPVPPKLETTVHEVEQFAHKFLSERLAVTGVQRKLSLALEDAESFRLTIIGSLGGSYIMKPPSPEYDQMPEIEDLSMHLAQACGIRTAAHGLLPMQDGALVYIAKRFDRKGRKKIAVEDLCQLSGLLTEQKYRSSHERAGKVIRRFSSVPGDDVLRFFELVVFSFVIGNNDMHLKNFSLMTDDPQHVHLTPAYDLLAVRLLVSKKDDPEEVALTLNGKKSRLKREDFLACGETLGIPHKVLMMALTKQIKARDEMFTWIARSFVSQDLQKRLKDLIDQNLAVLHS